MYVVARNNKYNLTKGIEYKVLSYISISNIFDEDICKLENNPIELTFLFQIFDDKRMLRYVPNDCFLSTREINIKKILNI